MEHEGVAENEYDRLMNLWTDVFYLRQFAKESDIKNIKSFIEEISEDAEDIQDFMNDVAIGIGAFFKNLYNNESGFRVLSLQKGKPHRKSYLRLYAIRIDAETYLITKGAITLVARMQENEELRMLNKVKAYLQDNDVFDSDSFQEFKTELDES